MDVGAPELIVILLIVLLLFGGAKLPQLARSLGHAQREFRKGIAGEKDPAEGDTGTDEPEPPKTA